MRSRSPPANGGCNAQRVMAEYRRLLASDPDESTMQGFLEKHPPLVLGAFPGMVGHGPFPPALIRQPPLRGLGIRLPDFMWITRYTGAVIPVLIEIEAPGKSWISGEKPPRPSADLSHALAQLREWREWFDSPANRQVFLDCYRIPEAWRSRRFR